MGPAWHARRECSREPLDFRFAFFSQPDNEKRTIGVSFRESVCDTMMRPTRSAQTERRGEAGPVSACLAESSPATFVSPLFPVCLDSRADSGDVHPTASR